MYLKTVAFFFVELLTEHLRIAVRLELAVSGGFALNHLYEQDEQAQAAEYLLFTWLVQQLNNENEVISCLQLRTMGTVLNYIF